MTNLNSLSVIKGRRFKLILVVFIIVILSAPATRAETVRYYDPETGATLTAEQIRGRTYVARTYDEAGRRLSDSLTGPDGEPVLRGDETFQQIEYFYDEDGNENAVGFFGTNCEPVLNNAGFHRCERTIDPEGNETSKSYFGLKGEPVTLNGYNFHRVEYAYVAAGRPSSVRFFGPGGEAVVNENGVHKIEYKYDRNGREISCNFFGVVDEPVSDVIGAHRVENTYDGEGNKTSVTFFDLAGNKVIPIPKD